MEIANRFGYKKTYISKYPEIFEKNIRLVLRSKYNDNKLYIQRFVNDDNTKTLNKKKTWFFENISLNEIAYEYYDISEITEFKNVITEIINLAHIITKNEISDSRRRNK
jgi:hypothetical protein